jgi:hypothetical protein
MKLGIQRALDEEAPSDEPMRVGEVDCWEWLSSIHGYDC